MVGVQISKDGKDESVFGLSISISAFTISCLALIGLMFNLPEIFKLASIGKIILLCTALIFVFLAMFILFKVVRGYYIYVQYAVQKYTEWQKELDDKKNKK